MCFLFLIFCVHTCFLWCHPGVLHFHVLFGATIVNVLILLMSCCLMLCRDFSRSHKKPAPKQIGSPTTSRNWSNVTSSQPITVRKLARLLVSSDLPLIPRSPVWSSVLHARKRVLDLPTTLLLLRLSLHISSGLQPEKLPILSTHLATLVFSFQLRCRFCID